MRAHIRKFGDFPRNTRDYRKSFKGDSHKEEASSAKCWEFKFTASSLSNNVNASAALAEFHASLLWLNKIVGGSVPIFTEINIIYFVRYIFSLNNVYNIYRFIRVCSS